MALTTYTTYDDVRAALGISATELADTVLSLTTLDPQALERVLDKFSTFETRYAELAANGSKSSMQTRAFNLMKVYYAYTCASVVIGTLDFVAYDELTDSRTKVKRGANPDVSEGVSSMLAYAESKLASLYGTLYPSDSITAVAPGARTLIGLAGSTGLAFDPVLNV